MADWFQIEEEAQMLTPALLFYSERIDANINKMIQMAGDTDRLRPHVKTYKCRELIQRQMDCGIRKFKCATLAEAAMLLDMGVPDVLLAYPLVGPDQLVFSALAAKAKGHLSVLIDHPEQIWQWKQHTKLPVHCYIDLNVGMNRTGILPEQAETLLAMIDGQLIFQGWHVYDGHIHASDPEQRKQEVTEAFRPVQELLNTVGKEYQGELICGGSITFPVHAAYPQRTLSPGTTVLWDHGYGSQFPDLNFDIAACLATRVVSKPAADLLCLNLGYKAVAAEMSETPVYFPQLNDAQIVKHSEEHLVLKTSKADQYPIGALLYAFPWHICPTVALHESAWLVRRGQLSGRIEIKARKRIY